MGPIPQLAERPGEISFPIVRDMDTFCYERQHGADMEVGSYAHRAILHDPEDIPSIEQAKLSPTEMPFTADDFDPQLEQAFELMPDALGADGAEIRYAINGLLSLTPDGRPILGETPEVKGLWSAAAVWIKEGPGVGRAVAEWMTHGHSEIDVHHSDIARFYPHQRTRAHVRPRTTEAFNKTYGIVHPGEQSGRRPRQAARADARRRRRQLGAVFFETVGWERPFWYESNAACSSEYGDAGDAARARVGLPLVVARSSTPSTSRCASAPASSTCPRSRSSTSSGPGALDAVQRIVRRAGRRRRSAGSIYTPVLDAKGGFRSDLTVMRLGARPLPRGHRRRARHGRPQVVRRPPAGRRPPIVDQTSAFTTIGLWGPRARDILGRAHRRRRLRRRASAFLTCREIELGSVAVLASRISYVGELGWELYVPMEQGAAAVGRCCTRPAGRTAPSRSGSASTAPPAGIEKGYRAYGFELDGERTIVEAGMERPKVKAADFVGREAYLAQREAGAADGAVHADRRRPHLGRRRQALHARRRADPDPRRRHADRRPRPPPLRHLGRVGAVAGQARAAWPTCRRTQAVVGNELAVSYMEELYPVTVGSVDATPLFDPANERIKG